METLILGFSKLENSLDYTDMELEDDLYFADLSKEIALLLMDEHEDPLVSYPADSLQVLYYLSIFSNSYSACFQVLQY